MSYNATLRFTLQRKPSVQPVRSGSARGDFKRNTQALDARNLKI